MSTDWDAWLGPAADDMTPQQRKRFEVEAQAAIERIGDDPDDQDDRDAALSAIVQYLLGDTTLDQAGAERERTQAAARAASIAAQTMARLAVQDGVSEVQAARRAGLTRMTVRRALGK